MSITANNRYSWSFTRSTSRTFTFTNDTNQSVNLDSFSVYLGSGVGEVNRGTYTNITPISNSVSAPKQNVAINVLLAQANWNWLAYPVPASQASGASFSATASVSYGSATSSQTKTISQQVNAIVGTRDTSTATYSVSYENGIYTARLTATNPYASQYVGVYERPSSKTTFNFSGIQIPPGASATITLTCNSPDSNIRAFAFYNSTGEPSVVTSNATAPTITNVTESITKFTSDNYIIQGKSVCTFSIVGTGGSTYEVYDGGVLLYSGSSASGTFTIPSNSTGTYTYKAKNGSLEASYTTNHASYPYTAPSLFSRLSQRCLVDGTLDDEGTYGKCNCTYTNGIIGTQTPTTLTTNVTISIGSSSKSTPTDTLPFILGGSLLTTQTYTVNYVLSDNVSTQTFTDTISIAKFLMDFVSNGVSVGTTAETDKFKVGSANNPLEISFNGNEIDYVVEEGTSGIWYYRKWNSGIAECFGKTLQISKAASAFVQWGSLYETDAQSYPNYPSGLFVSAPFLSEFSFTETNALLILASGGTPTTTAPQSYDVIRPAVSGTYTYKVCNHSVGRWK